MIDLRCEAVAITNGLSHWLDQIVGHFDSLAALMADEVMMGLIQQFVLTCPSAQIRDAHEAQFTEEVQGAVDR